MLNRGLWSIVIRDIRFYLRRVFKTFETLKSFQKFAENELCYVCADLSTMRLIALQDCHFGSLAYAKTEK